MITNIEKSNSPCESCGSGDTLLLEDQTNEQVVLCPNCLGRSIRQELESEDTKADKTCYICGTKRNVIRCFKRTENKVMEICLTCANKENDKCLVNKKETK